ncbi:MAG TPA: helix-turn-helix transcriptional regulator [Methylomirabilota bacterium]|nr:helix-turn-helix transcriptional regulator [Methylomirabilota bacterium]
MLSRELVAASSKPLVLSILARGENYGYAIMQEVKALSAEKIEWTEGMLYPVLHRLERDGLISSRWGTADNGRERKFYNLTDKGRAGLRKERYEWLVVHQTLQRLWKTAPASI